MTTCLSADTAVPNSLPIGVASFHHDVNVSVVGGVNTLPRVDADAAADPDAASTAVCCSRSDDASFDSAMKVRDAPRRSSSSAVSAPSDISCSARQHDITTAP
jgi:hypothetical protein